MNRFVLRSLSFAIALAAAPSPAVASGWDCDPVAWRLEGDAFVCANEGRALAPSPKGRRVGIRARVTPLSSTDPGYASLGVGVFDDLDRYWNLAVLKGPDSKGAWHRYELKAMSEGVWGAEETLMELTVNKRTSEWEWGRSFDLALAFAPDRVEGVVADAATGAELYRCVREAKEGMAFPVPAGRPCLFVSGDMRGRVENVEWTVEEEVPEQTRVFPAYRPVGPDTGLRGTATGFFHMETIDGRDWAVDPLGRATVLAGTDWCNPQGTMCEKLGYRPYGRWVRQNYASTEEWAEETAARLGSWGFTFLPCGGDASMRYRTLAWANAADRVYFSHRMCRGDPDWRICEYRPAPCTAFPNVFHPDFEAACDWWARQRCAPYRDDPWLVGYFVDNELAWWGDVFANQAGGLFDRVAKFPDSHPAKKALIAYLEKRGFAGAASAAPAEVKIGFLKLAAEKYFAATTAAIRKADPNHMVLGCRFAGGPNGVHPVVMETAGKYCDVVSFNHYPWADLDEGVVYDSRANRVPVADLYRDAHALAGKPLFLTEWSFPALDTGRPCYHGAGQRFRTQAERVEASELYARTLLSIPFFAGYSYFRWVDQPALGIRATFPEDSNYGLVSEEGVPYEGLTKMFARIHGNAAALRAAASDERRVTSDERRVSSDERKATSTEQSEHDRFFAEAESFVTRHSSLVTPAVAFAREGDRWTLSNSLVRISGRVGGAFMADGLAWGGDAPAGRFRALLQFDDGGTPVWTDATRVTDVSFSRDEATGIVTATVRSEGGSADTGKRKPDLQPGGRLAAAEGGGGKPQSADLTGKSGASRFALTARLSLAPGRADVLAEIVSAENLSSAPLRVERVFMRPYAAEARPREVDSVPNLWKGPLEDWWRLSDGSRFGLSSRDDALVSISLWIKDDGVQHPDARFGRPFEIAPGETWRPDVPMGARIGFRPK